MLSRQLVIIAASAFFGLANAATIVIDVGNNGLAFSPESVTANVGDLLEFHFYPNNHSVAVSDFAKPCVPAASGGFFSGFVPSASGESPTLFTVNVTSTNPTFIYCSQGSHCALGMYGVVNPSSDQSLAAYGNAVKLYTKSGVSPPKVFGGVLGQASQTTTVLASTTVTTATSSPSSTSSGSNSKHTNAASGLVAGSVSGSIMLGFGAALAVMMA